MKLRSELGAILSAVREEGKEGEKGGEGKRGEEEGDVYLCLTKTLVNVCGGWVMVGWVYDSPVTEGALNQYGSAATERE